MSLRTLRLRKLRLRLQVRSQLQVRRKLRLPCVGAGGLDWNAEIRRSPIPRWISPIPFLESYRPA